MTLSKEQMGAPHPDLNALAAFTDRRLTGEDRAALLAHLAGCAECRTILATMARGLPSRGPSRIRRWMPIAAGIVLTVAAGFVAARLGDPARPQDAGSSAVRPNPPSTSRGGTRLVDGKTFTLVGGEWVDAAYDPIQPLPVQEIAGAASRAALLQRTPALAAYAALGPNVTVVLNGVVYKFRS